MTDACASTYSSKVEMGKMRPGGQMWPDELLIRPAELSQ